MITDEQLKQWRADAEKAVTIGAYKMRKYCVSCDATHADCKCPQNFIALIDRIEKMKAALEFYANENTWKNSETCDCGCPVIGDVGNIAMEALK